MKLNRILMAALTVAAFDANAALYDRGNGLIYDSSLNITWLQDMSYVKTSGYSSTVYMSWGDANAWASSLNYNGISNWRLPSARLTGNSNFSQDGSTDVGYNNIRSELGHLYYADLQNKGGYDINGPITSLANISFVDAATNKIDSFTNMYNDAFWLKEPSLTTGWVFDAWDGLQYDLQHPGSTYAAIAVHDGDIAAVPIPAAAWLFGSGLIGLVGSARRRALKIEI